MVLGSGEPHLESQLDQMKHQFHGYYNSFIGYDEKLSHIIYAGADFLLMPSRVEPCGLNQMYASRVEHSVIGIRSRVGHGSTIVSTYIMGSDYYETLPEINDAKEKGIPLLGVGDRCYIKNAILDKNVRIGNDVRINGGTHLENQDHALFTVKDGIVVVKKGAVIPNGFVL